jgi:molecular chaperone GrpE
MIDTPNELPQQPSSKPADDAATTEAPATDGNGAQAAFEAQLAELERQIRDLTDRLLRAHAEMDNIRKRAQMDVASAHKYAIDNFAGELLPVYDALDAALATGNATAESLRDGVELTRKQLRTAFEKFGLTVLDPVGEKFDPHHHQAMTAIESDAPAQSVLQVFQKGFKLHDRVVRPALVAVAKPKADAGEAGTAPA